MQTEARLSTLCSATGACQHCCRLEDAEGQNIWATLHLSVVHAQWPRLAFILNPHLLCCCVSLDQAQVKCAIGCACSAAHARATLWPCTVRLRSISNYACVNRPAPMHRDSCHQHQHRGPSHCCRIKWINLLGLKQFQAGLLAAQEPNWLQGLQTKPRKLHEKQMPVFGQLPIEQCSGVA